VHSLYGCLAGGIKGSVANGVLDHRAKGGGGPLRPVESSRLGIRAQGCVWPSRRTSSTTSRWPSPSPPLPGGWARRRSSPPRWGRRSGRTSGRTSPRSGPWRGSCGWRSSQAKRCGSRSPSSWSTASSSPRRACWRAWASSRFSLWSGGQTGAAL